MLELLIKSQNLQASVDYSEFDLKNITKDIRGLFI